MNKTICLLFCCILLNTNSNAQNLTNKRWLGAGCFITGSDNPYKRDIITDGGNRNSVYNFNITIGKFIKENILIGFTPSYSYTYLENLNNYNDLPNHSPARQSNVNTESKSFGSGFFIRKHFKLYKERIYWWLQPSLNYSYAASNSISQYTYTYLNVTDTFSRYQGNYQKQSQLTNTIGGNLSIGATCFINKHFALTAGVSIFAINYNFGHGYNQSSSYSSYKIVTPNVEQTNFKTNGITSSFLASASTYTSISLSFLF